MGQATHRHQLPDPEARKLRAEVLRRHLLDGVRLVEHHRVVFRQHGGARISGGRGAQREIREEEVVVDYDHVRFRGLLPHAKDETAIVVRALGSDALIRRRRQVAPGGEVLRELAQLRAVAGLRGLRPRGDGVEDGRFLAHREGRIAQELLEPQQAEIVLPPLEEGDLRIDAERPQKRHVLLRELLLERLGRGRDDCLESAARRGKQVRQGLPGACPGLDHQRPPAGERVLDLRRHRQLRRARLVRGKHARERSARTEHLAQ